jgi:hypothetical protein
VICILFFFENLVNFTHFFGVKIPLYRLKSYFSGPNLAKFHPKEKHWFGGNSGLHAKLLRTQCSSPHKKGSTILMMLYFSIIWKTCGKLQSKQYSGLSAMRHFPY